MTRFWPCGAVYIDYLDADDGFGNLTWIPDKAFDAADLYGWYDGFSDVCWYQNYFTGEQFVNSFLNWGN